MTERNPVTPLLDWLLCIAAIAPFLALAIAGVWGPTGWRAPAETGLVGYAAIVLGFIGGHRWGEEVGRRGNAVLMFLATLPALAAWAAFLLILIRGEGRVGLALLIGAMAGSVAWDLLSPTVPRWYKPMRVVMALGAIASLGLVLWASMRG